MGWHECMVPELTFDDELQVRAAEREIREKACSAPDEAARIVGSLARLALMRGSIIEKLIGRIQELELGQVVSER